MKQKFFFKSFLFAAVWFVLVITTGCQSPAANTLKEGDTRIGSGHGGADAPDGADASPVDASQPEVQETGMAEATPSGPALSGSAKEGTEDTSDCTESEVPFGTSGTNGYASPEEAEALLQDVLEQLDSYEESLEEP